MNTATLIFAAMAGLLLLTVQRNEAQRVCPANKTSTECAPCDQFCDGESRVCALNCIQGVYCKCETGYYRLSQDSTSCVLEEDCPQNLGQ